MYYLTFIKHDGRRKLDWADEIDEQQDVLEVIKQVSNSQTEQVKTYDLSEYKEIYISNSEGKTINKIKCDVAQLKTHANGGTTANGNRFQQVLDKHTGCGTHINM